MHTLFVLGLLLAAGAMDATDPEWLTEYIAFHHSMRMRSNARYLVFDCGKTCGGIGDRVKGLIITFYAAIITRRVFLLRMQHPSDITTYLVPNNIDWTWPANVNTTCDLVHDEFARVPRWLSRLQMRDIWGDERVVCTRTNQYDKVLHVLLKKTTAFGYYVNRSPSVFVGTAFRTLFQPSAAVWNRISYLTQENRLPHIDPGQFLQRSKTFWIAAHARDRHGARPDGNFGKDPRLHQHNAKTVAALIGCLKIITEDVSVPIYLASDSATAKRTITQAVRGATHSNIPILHFDTQTAVDHTWTWAEFLLMGHASCVITAHYSGFSMIASYLIESFHDTTARCFVMEATDSTLCRTTRLRLKRAFNESI